MSWQVATLHLHMRFRHFASFAASNPSVESIEQAEFPQQRQVYHLISAVEIKPPTFRLGRLPLFNGLRTLTLSDRLGPCG